MTERQWDECQNPEAMLAQLRGGASDRKLRLFACACCAGLLHLARGPDVGRLLAVALAFADEQAAEGDLLAAVERARLYPMMDAPIMAELTRAVPLDLGMFAFYPSGMIREPEIEDPGADQGGTSEEQRRQAALVQCVFGNPLRTVSFDPTIRRWNGGAAVALAKEMYAARDFGRAPLLADMLEDAGATDAHLLEHLRGPGPHARGCFAIDLVLGRE